MRLGMRAQLAMVVVIAAALPLGLGLLSISFLGRRVFRAEKGALYETMAVDLSNTLAEVILTQVESLNTWIAFGLKPELYRPSGDSLSSIDVEDILQVAHLLDAQWPELQEDDPPLRQILNNETSTALHRFQSRYPLFAEILIADEYGRLVAATNKTSDFYQADEEWWQDAQTEKGTPLYVRGIEYDASAGVHALDVAVPLRMEGAETFEQPVPVLKAILNVGPLLQAVGRMPLPEQPRMHVVLADGRVIANLAPRRGGRQLGERFPAAAIQRLGGGAMGWHTMALGSESTQLVGFARLRAPDFAFDLHHPPQDSGRDPATTAPAAAQGLSGLTPAYVVAHEDLHVVMKPFADQLRLLGLLGLFLVATFGALALWLAERRITQPLRLLRSAAQSIAAQAHLSPDNALGEPVPAAELAEPSILIQRLDAIRTTDEIEDLSRDFSLMGERVLKYHEQLEQEITLKNEEIQRDLEMAREFQEALLPREYPNVPARGTGTGVGLGFCHLYKPAFLVGGDFFDVARLSDTVAGIFVADVIGHGARSALITAILRTLLQDLSEKACDPAALLTAMNTHFHGLAPQRSDCIFVTACYLVIDTATQTLSCASAGHPSPLLLDPANATVSELLAGCEHDPALGLFPDVAFQAESRTVKPGQSLLLFTDGVVEATNPAGEMYGLHRLRSDAAEWMQTRDADLTAYIMRRVHLFLETAMAEDDICMVTVSFTPPAGAPEHE